MGWFDLLLILAWVLVVVTLCVAAILLMGADWRELSAWVVRRSAGRRRFHGRHRRT
ncbi:MAG: hypothetical protein ABI920_08335 [Casimicrobiaceae bacterium]